jgi:hypothetical protein
VFLESLPIQEHDVRVRFTEVHYNM